MTDCDRTKEEGEHLFKGELKGDCRWLRRTVIVPLIPCFLSSFHLICMRIPKVLLIDLTNSFIDLRMAVCLVKNAQFIELYCESGPAA